MPTPVSFPLFHITDPSTGMPLVGGLVWSYAAGTSTPIDTWAAWSPSGGYVSKNTNPIALDSDGNASIYIALPTKLIIEYPPPIGQTHGAVIDTLDNLEAAPYNSYVVIGNTAPPTPGTNQLGLYCSGTTLYIIDSTGAITSPATAQSIQQQSFSAATAGGTGDAITATLSPPLTALVDKTRVWITTAAANTTTIPTFSPNSLSPKTIVKGSNSPLKAGEIPGANAIILLEYNATLDKWVLINPYAKPEVIQVVNAQSGAEADGTGIMYQDDTIPQNTEGDEYLTLAITPSNANNKLLVEVLLNFSTSTQNTVIAALFKDSGAGALAASVNYPGGSGSYAFQMSLAAYITAGSTSAMTFKVRAGLCGGSGTFTLNGAGSSRLLGGVLFSSITISEIQV
jgi:hypothetical protein